MSAYQRLLNGWAAKHAQGSAAPAPVVAAEPERAPEKSTGHTGTVPQPEEPATQHRHAARAPQDGEPSLVCRMPRRRR
ncbi:hypothetical protein OG379_39310 [Streptomyces sp. NBC_01166]|uniref:hypothetical protein n=1 Tax=Streptomyces sp. NBC_01166 TaxID=2903755 RepID=UPI003867084E|nr:hypothetical protein OG379_39310 [Streptomyces sp. NBC_01166]